MFFLCVNAPLTKVQGVMPVGKRLARAGLVWMAFFKSA
jgi:hypothetical protein